MEAKKILIIEDEADLREALMEALSNAGYTVTAEATSEVALRGLKNNKPDLILLDLFTQSIHGTHFMERIHGDSTLASIKIIVLTNVEHEKHRKKTLALGAKQYLIKADTPLAEVLAAVKSTLA